MEHESDGNEDDDRVQEDDEAPPDDAKHVETVRQPNLLDDPLALLERPATFVDHLRNKTPRHVSHSKKGKVDLDIDVKDPAVDHAQNADEHGHAERDPKGAELGAAVALADIVPTQHRPERPSLERRQQVASDGL